jgi:hypothetical protein
MRISNKVFSESYQVLDMLNEETKVKIPSEIWSLLELNSDKSLYFDYNKDVSLDKQPMSRETKALLISIYRDYLCDEQTKKEINATLTKNANSRSSTVGDETNIINLIDIKYANEGLKAKEESKDLAIIEKQSLISKIFAKIKKLFKGQGVEEDNII